MDMMSAEIKEVIAENKNVAQWAIQALGKINRKGGKPEMVFGRKCEKAILVDDGRSLILPLDGPDCCACLNESGGVTLMLAREY